MAFIKTMTIDDYYTKEEAIKLSNIIKSLNFTEVDFGREVDNFNVFPEDVDKLFSSVLGRTVELDKEKSGIFRFPELFIHFEEFTELNEWLFVVALQNSTFDIYEHKSGAKTALDDYKFNYKNLFEWDLTVNHLLEPGQGVFFRPWLFHSFNQGLIQVFRLKEV